MPWIQTIPWNDADGLLREAYDWQARTLGEPAEFTQLGSLYPELVMERLRLYKVVEGCPSGLTPIERQGAALVASRINGTVHCASGLSIKLSALGAHEVLLTAIDTDPAAARSGEPRLDAILAYASRLTARPQEMNEEDIASLRAHGLSDLDILDLNNVVAYYCYINRVVNGLGLTTVMETVQQATQAVPT